MKDGPGRTARWRPTEWSLRTRLLAGVLASLTVVCAIVGVVTELALREYLIAQLDDNLGRASERRDRPPNGGGPGGPRPPPPGAPDPGFLGPGDPVGTLFVRAEDGRAVLASYVRDVNGSVAEMPVPTESHGELLAVPADGVARTVDLGELGEYRVIARTTPDDAVLISGLPLAEIDDAQRWIGLTITAIMAGGLLLAGVAGAFIVRTALRPLDRVAETASRVAELPLDRGEVALSVRVPEADTNPRTEVGMVGIALNRMLGHVGAALAARQASELRVRRFVADASHELRTPLAAIRGYAELTRRGNQEVPPDVAYALRRVESETARMTALVNDLLLLARLDSADPDVTRTLASGPVDLSRLVVDTASDAHVAGPDHRWRLDLPEESITVLGDEAQLHHVLGNLLGNARTHTPAGTTVVVRLSVSGSCDHAVLTVTDDGPGIPPALLPEVFHRFARGDTSRSRAAGSTGLGLAIVAAVVQAHHGTVDVTSEPGTTVFTVRLPLATVASPAPHGDHRNG